MTLIFLFSFSYFSNWCRRYNFHCYQARYYDCSLKRLSLHLPSPLLSNNIPSSSYHPPPLISATPVVGCIGGDDGDASGSQLQCWCKFKLNGSVTIQACSSSFQLLFFGSLLNACLPLIDDEPNWKTSESFLTVVCKQEND